MRVLKPGGEIVCCVPFLQPYHGYPHHYYNMTAQGLVNLFADHVQVDSVQVLDSVLPIWSLTWIVKSWVDGLKGKTRKAFLDMRIEDFAVASALFECAIRARPVCGKEQRTSFRLRAAGPQKIMPKKSIMKKNLGSQHVCHPCGAKSRSLDRRDHGADLCDVDICAEESRRASGVRIFTYAKSDAHGVRTLRRGSRRRDKVDSRSRPVSPPRRPCSICSIAAATSLRWMICMAGLTVCSSAFANAVRVWTSRFST